MKTTNRFLLISISFIILLNTNCIENKKENQPVKKEPQPALFIIGVDGSGSYKYREQANKSISIVINNVKPSSIIKVRWISEDSYNSKNAIFSGKTPAIVFSESENPFDSRAKIKKVLYLKKLKEWQTETISQIIAVPSPRSHHSDIYGFCVFAKEQLQKTDLQKKYIIILSDLANNVSKYTRYLSDGCLDGAEVIIGSFQNEDFRRKQVWTKNFSKYGASKILFFTQDENSSLQEYLTKSLQ